MIITNQSTMAEVTAWLKAEHAILSLKPAGDGYWVCSITSGLPVSNPFWDRAVYGQGYADDPATALHEASVEYFERKHPDPYGRSGR